MITWMRQGVKQGKDVSVSNKMDEASTDLARVFSGLISVLREVRSDIDKLDKKIVELSDRIEELACMPVTVDGYTANSELKEHITVLVNEAKKTVEKKNEVETMVSNVVSIVTAGMS